MTREPLEEMFSRYPEHLTVVQLASVLGISRTATYKWLQTGMVPAYKRGETWIILRDEVLAWVKAGRNTPAVPTDETPEQADA